VKVTYGFVIDFILVWGDEYSLRCTIYKMKLAIAADKLLHIGIMHKMQGIRRDARQKECP